MDQKDQPVQSQVMFMYSEESNYSYPKLAVPPIAHAPLREEITSDGKKRLILNYGGVDAVVLETESGVKLRYRRGSDGNVQSQPLIQQFGVSAEHSVRAKVTLRVREDGLCMRPRRASDKEAILGQHGRPLIYGANGFYGIWEDLLIEWHGADWAWIGEECIILDDGAVSASFEFELTPKPFLIMLRPRYYEQHLGYRYHKPWERTPNPKAISGWSSWEAYHDQVTEENVRDAACQLGKLASYGLEYIQLDDGYEQILIPPDKDKKVFESWLKPNEKFSGEHEAIVCAILKNGLVPGIWTNTMVNNEEAANTGGLCMQENGQAFRGQWIQFILSCTEETLREHVLPYYVGLREKGYRYFKTDALRHLMFDGLQECVRRNLLTDEEVEEKYRRFFLIIRKGIGKDIYLLSCWGALGQCIGIADACRIATDTNPNWPAIQMQVEETARWFFAQRVLFTLDPDHVCARTNPEWARMLLSFVSLTGGLYMLSDPIESYDEVRMNLIRKTLPGQEIYAAETGAVEYVTPAFYGLASSSNPEEYSRLTNGDHGGHNFFGTLWATHYAAKGRRWTVILRTALSPLSAAEVLLADIGVEHGRDYAVYDFWREEFLGCVKDAVPMRELGLGETQAVAVVAVEEGLTLVGSTRHISMDTVSVEDCIRKDAGLRLNLCGIVGDTVRYCFYGKGEWTISHCEGGSAVLSSHDGVVWVKTVFESTHMLLEIDEKLMKRI